MRISRVTIRRWRSIKDIDFFPSDMTVLVGANNAGKTNILSAINFLIGERWPMPANLDDTDFYGGSREFPIYIRLGLEGAGHVAAVEFDTGRDNFNFRAIDRHDQQIRGFSNEDRLRLPFAFVDAGRSFDRQFGVSRYTLFGQAIRRLHDELREGDEGTLEELRRALDTAHGLLRTDLYQTFETHLRDAFSSQLRTARYDVNFEFRTIDETNLYRGLYPILLERGLPRAPHEVGSGVRNLLVLALFQAFARTFRGGAVLGFEEPELYLHPHAQRSLNAQFERLVAEGNQIFLSTHSASFLDVTRTDRIALVTQCEDEEEEICTQVRTTGPDGVLRLRQRLHPGFAMTVESVQAFLRNVSTLEMAEPFFARLVVIVEGPSEREALPILCKAAGLDFDEEGVSIVSAGGKTVIDTIAHVYEAHEIPMFVVFDNDADKPPDERAYNRVICRLVGLPETDLPDAAIHEGVAVLAGDWETQMRADLERAHPGLYDGLAAEARQNLQLRGNKNKPLVARYVATALAQRGINPTFIEEITRRLRALLQLDGQGEVGREQAR